jgi:hypothetical protein
MMIINTTVSDNRTFYSFSKGRFSYTAVQMADKRFGHWEIWTTDNSKSAPDNVNVKVMFENEMKAKIWQAFFSLVSCEAVAA